MEKYMKIELTVIIISLFCTLSAAWYLGARSYDITGTVSDLQSTSDGQYFVMLTDNQQLRVKGNLIVFGNINEKQLFENLEVGQKYVFNCWGETPNIYKATPAA